MEMGNPPGCGGERRGGKRRTEKTHAQSVNAQHKGTLSPMKAEVFETTRDETDGGEVGQRKGMSGEAAPSCSQLTYKCYNII